ncbi:MAG: hypothetical protein J6Y37_15185 [Paludibacteraceae bacterium]|nr:hypothetical protein [Paludibacteraceae bacterium]
MKKLVSNESGSYCSETVEHNGRKFKVVSRSGNAYSHLEVYVYTVDGGLALIANEYDIPGYKYVDYVLSEMLRLPLHKGNVKAAEDYISRAFPKVS